MNVMIRMAAVLFALALGVTACGGDGEETAETTSSTTTSSSTTTTAAPTTTESTTTTTEPPDTGPYFPLTGESIGASHGILDTDLGPFIK